MVKDLLERKKKVILVPDYKSFMDIYVLLYALYEDKMEIPFSYGNSKDRPKINSIDSLLRNIGHIPAKRSYG
jgi:hypothetical protein